MLLHFLIFPCGSVKRVEERKTLGVYPEEIPKQYAEILSSHWISAFAKTPCADVAGYSLGLMFQNKRKSKFPNPVKLIGNPLVMKLGSP